MKETQTANSDLKKRKLVVMQKRMSFKIGKGTKFALEIVKEETDLTPEMIARWVFRMAEERTVLTVSQRCLEGQAVQALQLCCPWREYPQRSPPPPQQGPP